MLNDRFNSGSRNDFGNKFRDKKFVSVAAIGVFVLILVVVLVAKGCGSKSRERRRQRQAQQAAAYRRNQLPPPTQPQTPAYTAPTTPEVPPPPAAPATIQPRVASPAAAPAPRVAPRTPPRSTPAVKKSAAANNRKAAGEKLIRDGRRYLNGENGVKPNYAKAKACFEQAKKLGAKNADAWLRVCRQKMKKR